MRTGTIFQSLQPAGAWPETLKLRNIEWGVLMSLDGTCTVAQIQSRFNLSHAEAELVFNKLSAKGLIRELEVSFTEYISAEATSHDQEEKSYLAFIGGETPLAPPLMPSAASSPSTFSQQTARVIENSPPKDLPDLEVPGDIVSEQPKTTKEPEQPPITHPSETPRLIPDEPDAAEKLSLTFVDELQPGGVPLEQYSAISADSEWDKISSQLFDGAQASASESSAEPTDKPTQGAETLETDMEPEELLLNETETPMEQTELKASLAEDSAVETTFQGAELEEPAEPIVTVEATSEVQNEGVAFAQEKREKLPSQKSPLEKLVPKRIPVAPKKTQLHSLQPSLIRRPPHIHTKNFTPPPPPPLPSLEFPLTAGVTYPHVPVSPAPMSSPEFRVAASDKPLSLQAVTQFIFEHAKDENEGQLLVYQVFMRIPAALLEQSGLETFNFEDEYLVSDPKLQEAMLHAIEVVLDLTCTKEQFLVS